jgi:glycosyltransferase involved in cell wall biosynthesis
MVPSVVILTFNSAASLRATLESVRHLSDDIHVVDSGSLDQTLEIAGSFGASIHHHPFENYGKQRNWSIAHLSFQHDWQLHLDADERLTDELRLEILALSDDSPYGGYLIPRYLRFLRRTLKYNLAPTWHLRLFRTGQGRCEDREYDQHFLCVGKTTQLRGHMIDDIQMSLSEWTYRHNRWADAEVRELLAKEKEGRVKPNRNGDLIERKRYWKDNYERCPLFLRVIVLFFFRYFLKGGFLDGTQGLIFCVLQTLWFRFLVDAKLWEIKRRPADSDT